METKVEIADLYNWKEVNKEAAKLLLKGEVVAVPSETVYGLAASISHESALKNIFLAKERPSHDPLIVHIHDLSVLPQVAIVEPALQSVVNTLANQFWPGPLTLVLPKHPDLSPTITSTLDTVAVRIPSNEIFRDLCKLCGPLAAPSANRFGRISPTSASAVLEELDGRIPLIIDGGACINGIESTIISLAPPPSPGKKPIFTLLRPGATTREELREIGKVEKFKPKLSKNTDIAPAPGLIDFHYAPSTPLYLFNSIEEFVPKEGKKYGLLSLKGEEGGYYSKYEWDQILTLSPGSGKTSEGAVRLYWAMRQLDKMGLDAIIAEPVSTANMGEAVMDRLRRASHRPS